MSDIIIRIARIYKAAQSNPHIVIENTTLEDYRGVQEWLARNKLDSDVTHSRDGVLTIGIVKREKKRFVKSLMEAHGDYIRLSNYRAKILFHPETTHRDY